MSINTPPGAREGRSGEIRVAVSSSGPTHSPTCKATLFATLSRPAGIAVATTSTVGKGSSIPMVH